MAGAATPRALRLPLHVTLASVFVSVLLLFGGCLIVYHNVASRRMALLSAADLIARIDAHMRTAITGLYQPAQGLVDLASKTLDGRAANLAARRGWLDTLAEALRLHPDLSAVYVGFDDGDFFLVRSLAGRAAAVTRLEAPEAAAFAVQSIEHRDDGTTSSRLLFFDDALRPLAERPFPSGVFDPRKRAWFRAASATSAAVTTDFYVFFTTGEVGLTFARRLAGGGGVFGADLALDDLSAALARQRVTPGCRIAIVDAGRRVIALSDGAVAVHGVADRVELPRLEALDDPLLDALGRRLAAGERAPRFELSVDGRRWLAARSALPTRTGDEVLLTTLVPRDELLAPVDRVRNTSAAISLLLLGVTVALVLWVSRNVSGSLRTLAAEARQIRRFRLSTPIAVRSRVAEVDELAATMAVMKSSLQQSFAISRALATEQDPQRLLEMVLREASKVADAAGGAILMATDDGTALEVAILEHAVSGVHWGGTSGVAPSGPSIPWNGDAPDLDLTAGRDGRTLVIDDLDTEPAEATASVRARFDHTDLRTRSLLSIPLVDPRGELLGLLQLVDARGEGGFDRELVPVVEDLAADAAVALDLRRLLRAQRELLHAIIHMVAGAIDAKSPYTHGHCQRVPDIARRLAEAAHASDAGPLADFSLADDEWEELHIASWLHDCGKLTTPEYVVDKATRLETLHNRIHEIRTRFEVLWRDAELACWRAVAAGEDEARTRAELAHRQDELRDDWEFVAECNLGETVMDDQRIARLERLAATTWLRHFDDHRGLSHEELERRRTVPVAPLPATETLLQDAPWHQVPRPNSERPFGDNPHGFRMDVPPRLYHHGELYNLLIRRGTLTLEERFKISEHIVQTIEMLGRLPFPRELTRVPEWAGNHHEKLDGTGYPRRLDASQLSVPARIMAVADVFEALTATDRPYLRPKTLSSALGIMASMCRQGHLDPTLFELLLRSGVYLDYARANLRPEQLDDVDVEALVGACR